MARRTTISLNEAEARLSHYLARVAVGEEIVITRRGIAIARLVPPKPIRRPGLMKGRLPDSFFDPLPEGEMRAWEGR